MDLRYCNVCKLDKELSEFYNTKTNTTNCKQCSRDKQNEYNRINRDKVNARNKEKKYYKKWNENNKIKQRKSYLLRKLLKLQILEPTEEVIIEINKTIYKKYENEIILNYISRIKLTNSITLRDISWLIEYHYYLTGKVYSYKKNKDGHYIPIKTGIQIQMMWDDLLKWELEEKVVL